MRRVPAPEREERRRAACGHPHRRLASRLGRAPAPGITPSTAFPADVGREQPRHLVVGEPQLVGQPPDRGRWASAQLIRNPAEVVAGQGEVRDQVVVGDLVRPATQPSELSGGQEPTRHEARYPRRSTPDKSGSSQRCAPPVSEARDPQLLKCCPCSCSPCSPRWSPAATGLSTRLQADGLGDIAGGTVYPVLARLEREGLITSREDQHELVTDRSPQAHRPATTRLVRVQG